MNHIESSLIHELKTRGVRITPQRAIIFNVIENMSGHVTAEEIFSQVQQVNAYISLATIYRTLELMRELGMVTESNMGTTTTHYALRTHGTHHHAVCHICGISIELPLDLIEPTVKTLNQSYNFVADANHIVIFGWCENCYDGQDKNIEIVDNN